MASSISQIKQDIVDAVESIFPAQKVVVGAMPDTETLIRNKQSKVDPYVVLQFGDLQPWGNTSMAGPHGDDYRLPVRAYIVAPTVGIGDAMRDILNLEFIGSDFDWAGQIRKRGIGADSYPIVGSTGATEAYSFPTGFALVVQLSEITP